jgi:hypothetical protein
VNKNSGIVLINNLLFNVLKLVEIILLAPITNANVSINSASKEL